MKKGEGLFLVEQAKLDLSQNVLVMTRMSKRNIRHNIERYSEWNTEWNIKPYLYQMGNSFQRISKIRLLPHSLWTIDYMLYGPYSMGKLMLFVIQIKMIVKIKLLPFKVKNIAFTKALPFLCYGGFFPHS